MDSNDKKRGGAGRGTGVSGRVTTKQRGDAAEDAALDYLG